jgi:hypothetical protein
MDAGRRNPLALVFPVDASRVETENLAGATRLHFTVGMARCSACLALSGMIIITTPAVVVVAEAVVCRGPLDESQSLHLRDGSEITVLDQKNDWLQVVTSPNELAGCVASSDGRPAKLDQQAPHEAHG